MKKKNIMLGLAIFAALNAGTYALASDNPFATVPQKTGYYQDVAALVHDGLIDGYADSDFNAKHPLTRYEMAVFTAKAMSKMQSADAADTQRIQKLMKEFQSELTDLHVRVPGVKAKKAGDKKKSSKGPKIKKAPNNWDVSGLIRYRLDGGTKEYANGTKKSGADGFGGEKNHQLMWQLFNKFDIGGGWKGEIDFIGAKDGNGDKRTTGENTDGYADFNKLFVTGPIGKVQTRIGRMKGSWVGSKSMVMGQYYEGVDTRYKTGKWTVGASWGKVDYTNNVFTGDANAANSSVSASQTIKKGKNQLIDADYVKNTANLAALRAALDQGILSNDGTTAFDAEKVKAEITSSNAKLAAQLAADKITEEDYNKQVRDYDSEANDYISSAKKLYYLNTTGKDMTLGSKTYYYKPERGVSDSDVNPPGLGLSMTQLQAKYQAAKNFAIDFNYWHLHGNGEGAFNAKQAAINDYAMTNFGIDTGKSVLSDYPDPDIGEINAVWNATPKFTVIGHFAMSNMRGGDNDWDSKSKGKDGDKNKAYALTFQWGKMNAAKPHSREFDVDLIHMEQFTGIKATYDLKNKTGEGQQGLIMRYRYAPVKNVMMDFRWMHYKTIGVNSHMKDYYHGNQYRWQMYYYF